MVDLQEMCFDLRKGSVTRLNVRYMRFHLWKGEDGRYSGNTF